MLTPTQAADAIFAAMPEFGTESVPVADACGRVLRQPVRAERDQPPFDRVTMDGIALSFAAFDRGLRRFTVQGTQHAGDPAQTLDDETACIEVMTGAVMPPGADCVVPVERIANDGGIARVEDGYSAEPRQFIHPQGSDYRRGNEVLADGHTITPLEIAVIASCGLASVTVSAVPAIRVISTGNELVPAGQAIEPHQIRLSNGPAVVAQLRQQGYRDCTHDHIVDDERLLRDRLARHLDEAAILILSGGVSMGKADFVPRALTDLSVRQVFHKVSQRPGKPFWFGTGARGQAVFALPGNPVSTLVCCRHYVLPALAAASGEKPGPVSSAVLTEAFHFPPSLTCFLPVRLAAGDDGRLLATPAPTNTSGDFTSLCGTDGYVELERDRTDFPAGTVVPFHPWAH
ncbi:MAG: molybdopterin molybdotransferase MoeA [Woeseiaceae bacterium]